LDELNRLTTETKGITQIRDIAYDKTDQVTGVSGSNNEAYAYDLNGNRLGGGYTTASGNRLMSDGTYTYDYDDEGNRTRRTKIAGGEVDNYTWDYRNRLVSIVTTDAAGNVLKTVGYEYDVDDQRVKKTVDGVVENYYIDRNQIAFVTDGTGNETFHYLYGLNVDAVLAQDATTGMLWSLADRLGSIDLLTDGDGVVVDKRTFDSFGRVLSQTNPSVSFRYGYTARELDLESGLSYYRARYYDSNVGRFISVDPMGFEAGDTNLYRYVGNNSTNANDPSGEFWHILGGAAIGAVVGGGMSFLRQTAQMIDGKRSWGNYDVGEIALATGAGLIAGGLIAAVPQLATSAMILGGSSGIVSASNEFRKGNFTTGLFDLATAGLSFLGSPPGSSPKFAMAGGGSLAPAMAASNTGVLGGSAAVGVQNIFQPLFAAIADATGNGNREKPIPDGEQSPEERAADGGSLPPDVARNPGKYFYDPVAGRYKSRPEPTPDYKITEDGVDPRAIPCFAEGTLVSVKHGYAKIETLKLGDLVLSFDEESNRLQEKRVLDLLRNRTNKWFEIELEDESIITTKKHRFWIEKNKAWVEAQFLQAGMNLKTFDGRTKLIKNISIRETFEESTFNLTIEDYHTYFVGINGCLVHNEDKKIKNGKIYYGVNPDGEIVYVGQTEQTLEKRQYDHRQDAINSPDKYSFKKDIKLVLVLDGLTTRNQMFYHERKTFDDLSANGANLQNRQTVYTDASMNKLIDEYC
jgi:RHS repeat-associated protein